MGLFLRVIFVETSGIFLVLYPITVDSSWFISRETNEICQTRCNVIRRPIVLSKPVITSLVTDYPLPYSYRIVFYHDFAMS